MKNKIISIILVILLVSTFSIAWASETSDLEKQKSDLTQKVNESKEKLNQIKDDKETATSALDSINAELDKLNNDIALLQAEIDSLQNSINEKEKEIEEKQKDIEAKQKLLEKRLVQMYKQGNTTYLDVILGSSSYVDMLINYDLVKQITEIDNKIINQIEEEKTEIEKQKKSLEEQKKQLDTKKAEQDAKAVVLKEKQESKKTLVNNLSDLEKQTQQKIDEYNSAMARVNSALQEAYRKAQSQLKKYGDAGVKFDGSFIWPCNNKIITSRMKWRWGRQHKGIDIGAYYESVYASASGVCYNATDRYGYGTYIMIFHGGGYVTLYGHLNASYVYDGQYVKQGAVIAQSGNTGGSTGPHLHFEIRIANSIVDFFNKSPEDPLNYLPGGYQFAADA